MQYVARNVAKVELDSTSATAVRNVARKIELCQGHPTTVFCKYLFEEANIA